MGTELPTGRAHPRVGSGPEKSDPWSTLNWHWPISAIGVQEIENHLACRNKICRHVHCAYLSLWKQLQVYLQVYTGVCRCEL